MKKLGIVFTTLLLAMSITACKGNEDKIKAPSLGKKVDSVTISYMKYSEEKTFTINKGDDITKLDHFTPGFYVFKGYEISYSQNMVYNNIDFSGNKRISKTSESYYTKSYNASDDLYYRDYSLYECDYHYSVEQNFNLDNNLDYYSTNIDESKNRNFKFYYDYFTDNEYYYVEENNAVNKVTNDGFSVTSYLELSGLYELCNNAQLFNYYSTLEDIKDYIDVSYELYDNYLVYKRNCDFSIILYNGKRFYDVSKAKDLKNYSKLTAYININTGYIDYYSLEDYGTSSNSLGSPNDDINITTYETIITANTLNLTAKDSDDFLNSILSKLEK